MRTLHNDEMQAMLNHLAWATICTVTPQGEPYAIEATPFRFTPDSIGFMINPRGTTRANLRSTQAVLLKYTYASQDLRDWAGLSCFGTADWCTEKDKMVKGWELLGQVTGTDYSRAAERFLSGQAASPFFLVHITKMTGRCSAGTKEQFLFPWDRPETNSHI